MALTKAQRKRIPKRDFVFPRERKYPIDTRKRGQYALSLSALHGKQLGGAEGRALIDKVYGAVLRKYPSLKNSDSNTMRAYLKRKQKGRRSPASLTRPSAPSRRSYARANPALEGVSGRRRSMTLNRLGSMTKAELREWLEFRGFAVYDDETKAELKDTARQDLLDEMGVSASDWRRRKNPSGARLVDEETGKAVRLPYKTKSHRGDPITVTGFTEPHKRGSTGRISTKGGREYFPGVAGLKIVGHRFDASPNPAKKRRKKVRSLFATPETWEDLQQHIDGTSSPANGMLVALAVINFEALQSGHPEMRSNLFPRPESEEQLEAIVSSAAQGRTKKEKGEIILVANLSRNYAQNYFQEIDAPRSNPRRRNPRRRKGRREVMVKKAFALRKELGSNMSPQTIMRNPERAIEIYEKRLARHTR